MYIFVQVIHIPIKGIHPLTKRQEKNRILCNYAPHYNRQQPFFFLFLRFSVKS